MSEYLSLVSAEHGFTDEELAEMLEQAEIEMALEQMENMDEAELAAKVYDEFGSDIEALYDEDDPKHTEARKNAEDFVRRAYDFLGPVEAKKALLEMGLPEEFIDGVEVQIRTDESDLVIARYIGHAGLGGL